MKTRSRPKSKKRSSGGASAAPPRRATALRLARGVALLGLLGIGVLSRVRYLDWCIHDDAFISFRYARNLVRGDGLVMNPGERVEGFTNFLWTMLSVPALALGLDPATTAQVLGGAISLALVLGVFLFVDRRLGGGWYSLVTPLFLVGNLAWLMESLSGLETMAFSGLVFLAYVVFLEERRGGAVRAGSWAGVCGVASLVRPEGMLVFAILATYATFGVLRGESARPLRQAFVFYAILVVPLVLFRLVYYDAWLPNTFYTKVGFTMAQVERGWRFTKHVFGYTMTAPLLLVTSVMTVVALVRGRHKGVRDVPPNGKRLFAGRPREEALAVAFGLVCVYVVYVLLVGGDYEPTNRFHTPVLVLIYLLFGEGIRTFVQIAWGHRFLQRALAVVLGVAVLAIFFLQSEQRIATVLAKRGWPYTRFEHHRQLRAVGEWLQHNTEPGTTIALSSIGALPYFADRPIVDMMGLTDRHIGRRRMPLMGQGPAGHEKGDGAYVLGRKPEIVLFDKGHLFAHEVEKEKVLAGARGVSELEIASSPEFARNYELRRRRMQAGVLHYFVRRDGGR